MNEHIWAIIGHWSGRRRAAHIVDIFVRSRQMWEEFLHLFIAIVFLYKIKIAPAELFKTKKDTLKGTFNVLIFKIKCENDWDNN